MFVGDDVIVVDDEVGFLIIYWIVSVVVIGELNGYCVVVWDDEFGIEYFG